MGKLKAILIDSEYEDTPLDQIPDEVYEEAILTDAQLIKLKRGKREEETDVQ